MANQPQVLEGHVYTHLQKSIPQLPLPRKILNALTGHFKVFSLNENLFAPRSILNFIYKTYVSRDTVPESSIAVMRDLDGNLDPARTSYITFHNPKKNYDPVVAIRFFDASPMSGNQQLGGGSKIPIEIEYPHLHLPDRIEGNNYLIELGRLGKSKSVEGDIEQLLMAASQLLVAYHYQVETDSLSIIRNGVEPVIYIEASAVGARFYRKMGFQKVFGPAETGDSDTYILKIPGDKFIQFYLRDSYSEFVLHE